MDRNWLFGKNKVNIYFKAKIFDRVSSAKGNLNKNKDSKMIRLIIFIAMFMFSIPDFFWGIFNLICAAFLGFSSIFFKIIGLKSFGSKIGLYGLNIALAVDQFFSVKAMGQDPDVTISMALGVANMKHENKTASVNMFWIYFAKFVNFIFSFQEDHVTEAIEKEEKAKGTVISIYSSLDKTKEAA